MDALLIRLLGPVEVLRGSNFVSPGPQGQRLLAVLSISVGHAVSNDRLAEALWEDEPPDQVDAIHSLVGRLRKLLGNDAIRSEDHSYELSVAPESIDACRFERLIIAAIDGVHDDPRGALDHCREALGLWHGTPFGDLSDVDVLTMERQRLDELRLTAVEVAYEAELAMGRPERVIPSIQAAVHDLPYREKLWYLLITALARDGRRVEALRACEEVGTILREVGLSPGADLRALAQRIYEEDPLVAAHLETHTETTGDQQE